MNLPIFGAEAALYRSSTNYLPVGQTGLASRRVCRSWERQR